MNLTPRWARQDDFNAAVYAASARHGVTPALIKATIAAESAFNPRAYRAEAPRPSLPPTPDFPQGGDASFGLMQVLSRTARGLGYLGPLDGLYDPATSIDLGSKYLGQQSRRYHGAVSDTVSSYNAGSVRMVSGRYSNQAYVDRVLGYLDYFRQWEAQKGRAPGTVPASFPEPDVPEPGRGGGGAAPDAPVEAKPVSPYEKFVPEPKRKPLWPVAAGLVAVWAVVAGMVVAFCGG